MSNMNDGQRPQAAIDPAMEEEDAGVGLVELLTWLGESKAVIGTVTGVVAIGSVVFALLQPNIFTARTTLLPAGSQQQSSSAAALAALGSLGGIAGSIQQKTPEDLYVRLLTSDSVLRPLAAKYSLNKRYDIETFETLRKSMARYVRVTSDKKAGLITVEVDDEDPKFAAELANAHATEVAKVLNRMAISEAQMRRVFFEQQLKETKENLIQSEQALQKVQEKSGMMALDQQAPAIIKAVADLKARIVEREVRLKVLRTSTTAQNPDVQLMSAELSALRSELARMESSNEAQGAGKVSLDIPINKLPTASVEYVRAMREVKFNEAMLGSMLRQFEIAKLDEAKDTPVLQQVDVAEPPDRKSKPSRAAIVLGATFSAFFLASLYVLLRRYFQLTGENNPDNVRALAELARAWRWRRRTDQA